MPSKMGSIIAVATLAVGSPALAACGGSSKSAKPAYVPLTQANFSSTMAAAVKGKHSVREVTTSGGRTASIEFDASGASVAMRISQEVPATKTSSAGTLVAILVGNDLYARKTPGRTGDKWLKYLASDANLAGVTGGMGKVNPATMVEGLTKGVTSFKYVGATTIAGSTVEQYQLTLSSAALGGTSSTNIGADSSVGESIYLNEDNTLRRVVLTMPASVGNAQLDFTMWGQPLGITAPPASEVKQGTFVKK